MAVEAPKQAGPGPLGAQEWIPHSAVPPLGCWERGCTCRAVHGAFQHTGAVPAVLPTGHSSLLESVRGTRLPSTGRHSYLCGGSFLQSLLLVFVNQPTQHPVAAIPGPPDTVSLAATLFRTHSGWNPTVWPWIRLP